MSKPFAAAVLVMMTAACSSLQTPAVRVDVVESTATDRWRATITQTEPTDAFLFPRTRMPYRAGRWKIVEPSGARWDVMDGHDAIVLERPSKSVTVEFASDFRNVEKEYPQNVPFTDGSRLLYTGHLRTRVRGAETTAPHRWTFVTSPDRPVRILGEAGTGTLRWSQDSSDETFVYFGSIVPETTPRMTLIVDPGMPQWVEQQMRQLVPGQFTYFAEKTRAELPFKPLVVVSYGGSKGSGRTFAGNGLQGMLSINISGEQWTPRSAAAEQEWYRHLAHEIYHLWGAQAFRHEDEAEWLSEASAEYASLLVSAHAGVMNEAAVERFLSNAAKACDKTEAGKPRTFYTCGVVSQKAVDDAARGKGSDIWAVWRGTYAVRRPYTTKDYLAAVERLGDPGATAALEAAIEKMSPRSIENIQRRGAEGAEISLAPSAPAASLR